MTDELLAQAVEILQGSEYEDIISDPDFKNLTKFFKIMDVDSKEVLYTTWYGGYLNISIAEDGNVYVANYLSGTAQWFN